VTKWSFFEVFGWNCGNEDNA